MTTDGSDVSLQAIEPLASLAAQMQARVTLLQIVPELSAISDTGFSTPHGILDKTREAEIAAARSEMATAVSRFGSTPVEIAVEAAEAPADGIVEYAHAHAVDIIAMASHGRSGLRRILLGSTAQAVLRRSHVPVLVFPMQE
jgi:nucleotide-binding universal stress UspA family protein